jgi:hypothetical protein
MANSTPHSEIRTQTQVTSAVLTEQDAASFIQMSRSFLRKCRRFGRGPVYHRVVGGRAVRYSVADLQAWLDANRVTHRTA